MALSVSYPLNSSFTGVTQLQSRGTIDTGDNLPAGIAGGLIIENGVMASTIHDTDDVTAIAVRSEIVAPSNTFAEWWYLWEFMIPSDFAPQTDPISLMQTHDTPDVGDGNKWVPFALYWLPSDMLATYVPAAALPAEGANGTIAAMSTFTRGTWHSACLHVKWSAGNSGFREFFLDGIPLFRHHSLATMYTDTTGPYFKLGCYDATHNARFGTAKAYFRNVEIWSGNDGYQTVLGQLPSMPPQRMEH